MDVRQMFQCSRIRSDGFSSNGNVCQVLNLTELSILLPLAREAIPNGRPRPLREEVAAHLPPMLDLIIENITENVMKINSMCDNLRLRYLTLKLD
jgi:hypothetical protein